MSSIFDDIDKFHTRVLELERRPVNLCSPDFMLERARFIQEELAEFIEAALTDNIMATVDGLLDIIYVAAGTLWFMGVPSQECWNAVQKANMAKVRGTTSRGNAIDAAKPEGWVPPNADIVRALEKAYDRSYNASNSAGPLNEGDLL